jgi:hypothetical protein
MAVVDELAPSVARNVGRWPMLLQPGYSFDPLAGSEPELRSWERRLGS